jgi:hypothetical protein
VPTLGDQVHVGITGTRLGATVAQKSTLLELLRVHDFTHWHHGLCVGVDTESHQLIRGRFPEAYIIGHPPIKTEFRGEFGERAFDELLPPKAYFARNRDIVDATRELFVLPYQSKWQPKGGTWYIYDYAATINKPVTVIWPSGDIATQRLRESL